MLCLFFFSSVYYTHIQPKLKRQWIILEFISAVAEWDPKEPCVATSVYSFTRFSTKFLWGINGCIMEICGNHQCCDKSVFCVTRLRMWRWIHNILDSCPEAMTHSITVTINGRYGTFPCHLRTVQQQNPSEQRFTYYTCWILQVAFSDCKCWAVINDLWKLTFSEETDYWNATWLEFRYLFFSLIITIFVFELYHLVDINSWW